ncbi:hypothetical protein TREES_T100015521 [Tupaia chinensis]|uniref:Uncharacterized protein n=1 Tax=Tupaia chinensis TaxID=246437 RepID=L9LBP4_TUPCH|nr:hypothetical protein TREES_T100015521 [Tupaia chinensis]
MQSGPYGSSVWIDVSEGSDKQIYLAISYPTVSNDWCYQHYLCDRNDNQTFGSGGHPVRRRRQQQRALRGPSGPHIAPTWAPPGPCVAPDWAPPGPCAAGALLCVPLPPRAGMWPPGLRVATGPVRRPGPMCGPRAYTWPPGLRVAAGPGRGPRNCVWLPGLRVAAGPVPAMAAGPARGPWACEWLQACTCAKMKPKTRTKNLQL